MDRNSYTTERRPTPTPHPQFLTISLPRTDQRWYAHALPAKGSRTVARRSRRTVRTRAQSRNVRPEWTSTTADWHEKAVEAAGRMEPAHTSPWKLASTYALLSIAESLLNRQEPRRSHAASAGAARQQDGELLTVAEVAEMTRLSVGTLRYRRSVGAGGPASFKLGRRVMYRRADVETWLAEAQ